MKVLELTCSLREVNNGGFETDMMICAWITYESSRKGIKKSLRRSYGLGETSKMGIGDEALRTHTPLSRVDAALAKPSPWLDQISVA